MRYVRHMYYNILFTEPRSEISVIKGSMSMRLTEDIVGCINAGEYGRRTQREPEIAIM